MFYDRVSEFCFGDEAFDRQLRQSPSGIWRLYINIKIQKKEEKEHANL